MDMAYKTYLGIRRVSRLEYLIAFLGSVRDGYDREDARRHIQKILQGVEIEKAKALGKKKARPVSGASLLPECEKMAVQLRFAARTDGHWALTPDGHQLINDLPDRKAKDFPGEKAKATLITRLWQVYPRFGQMILAILGQPEGEMILPARSADGSFGAAIYEKYGLDCDILTFKMIRELGTQLGLLNWYIVKERGKQLQRVYSIACVAMLRCFEEVDGHPRRSETRLDICLNEIGLDIGALTCSGETYVAHSLFKSSLLPVAEAKGYLVVETEDDCAFIKRRRDVSTQELEQVLWETYLERVNYRPRFPVLYPELRNDVCRRLRLPDGTFDGIIQELIETPQRLLIYPSGGTLDYARNLAHMHKYLPPKTQRGHFMIYLKIDRVK